MTYVVVIMADALGRPSRVDGQYLSAYDPDAGTLDTTVDPALALHFDSPGAALECWRQQSTVDPVRPDGKPNRPLTAFTVRVEPLEPGGVLTSGH